MSPTGPNCVVHGGDGDARENVRTMCVAAMHELGYRTTLHAEIRHDPQAPPNAEASANDAGLWISPQLAHDQARLPWVVHEEVAHHYLATTQGVPHGGTFVEQLLHEMFATWLQLRVFVGGGWMTWRDVTTTPMPEGGETPEVGYHLGKHIAATAASSPDSRAHLERWLADESVEERLRELSRALLDGLPFDGSAAELAAAIGEFYRGARAAVGEA